MWGVGSAENHRGESVGFSQEGGEGYDLSQQSMGFSLSQQLGSEIGLSQTDQSQGQTESQGKAGAVGIPTCLECQSTEIITSKDGDMVRGTLILIELSVSCVCGYATGWKPVCHLPTQKVQSMPILYIQILVELPVYSHRNRLALPMAISNPPEINQKIRA